MSGNQPSSAASPARILVVDDDPSIVELLTETLAAEGFAPVPCGRPEEALALADAAPPEVFLLDVMMPGCTGVELCRRLRESPRHRGAIVVLMTGHLDASGRESEIVRALASGADDYLIKPFGLAEAAARLHAWLRVKRGRDQMAAEAAAALAEARRQEATTQTILASMADALFRVAPDGSLRGCNRSAAEMLGRTEAELLALSVDSVFAASAAAREVEFESVREALRRGERSDHDTRLRRADGTILPVSISCSLLPDGDGEMVMLARDISLRRRLQEEQRDYARRLEHEVAERAGEIRRSEARFRALFEHVDHAILVTDPSGRVTSANPAAARFLGRPAEALTGLPVCEAVCGRSAGKDCPEDCLGLLSAALGAGSVTRSVTLRRADGAELPTQASLAALRGEDGGPYAAAWILVDLSERERLAAEAKRLHKYAEIVLKSSGAGATFVGDGPAAQEVRRFIREAAPVPSPVLILGESGAGKEVVARSLHQNSPRADRPFVVLDCSAVSASLLESELFGHEKGSFTGAHESRAGLAEVADGGTLFVDEIGEMPIELQAKLLRVLERGEYRRLGASRERRADLRVLAATHRDLAAEAKRGRFRSDLLFRLDVLSVRLPPLRERREDIALLAEHFLENSRVTVDGKKRLHPEVVRCLAAWDWPGNVRELGNVIERAVILSGAQERIGVEHLPAEIRAARTDRPAGGASLEEAEKGVVARALAAAGGNKTRAAEALGVTRLTLRRKMAKYGL